MQIYPEYARFNPGYGSGQNDPDYDLPYPNAGDDAVNGARQQMFGFVDDMSGSAEDQQRINNAPIPPWQTGAATPGTRSANTEQQLDHLLALFISMLLQQSQGGSETMQENRAPGSQHEHQGNPSPLTLMLMQIVMQLAQSPNGSTN